MTPPSVTDFFASPNLIDMDSLTGEPAALIRALVARGESGQRSLLPARWEEGTRWYGFARDGRQERLLGEELRSWLGPPVGMPVTSVITARDDMDAAAQRAFPQWRVLSVDVLGSWEGQARHNVAGLLDIWSLTPDRSVDAPRPVGRVLRRFYEALLAYSRADAEAALTELRTRSLVSATNLRFLRVQMLSELAAPQDLRDDPQLRGLTLAARPPVVTERLADAANVLLIEPGVREQRSLPSIGQAIEQDWPGLAVERHQVTSVNTARCFALVEMTTSEPRRPLIADVCGRFLEDALLAEVAAASGPAPAPAAVASAFARYQEGEYEAALVAAEQAGSTRGDVAVALAAACNLGTCEAAVRGLSLYSGLQASEQAALAQNAVEALFLERLTALTSEASAPDSWLEWIKGAWPDRPDLLSEWARSWSATAPGAGLLTDDFVVELLGALNDDRRGRVRNGLPVLVQGLLGRELTPSDVPLAVALQDVLLSSEPGRTERQASLSILEAVLLVGCSTPEYSDLLEPLVRQMSLLGPRDAEWLIQVLDLLALHTAPAPAVNEHARMVGRTTAIGFRDRLDAVDLALLDQLFPHDHFAIAVSTPGSTPADRVTRLRSVGMYSLLESATRQASVWIKERWPTVDVHVSNDHVNSPSLAAMARGVEVMLVQTSHAKHAATQALEAAVPDKSRLVHVHGRGATALLRGLLEWLQRSETPA